MYTAILLIGTILVHSVNSFALTTKCHWNNHCPYNYFATKTFYDAIRSDIRDSKLDELGACSPVALWSLNRHGTRRAGGDDTDDMRLVSSLRHDILDAHSAGRGRLCSQDIENIRSWEWDTDLDVTTSYLTESGYNELQDIARRLREKFPELLRKYDAEIFYFRPTSEQRTRMSSIAFVVGLFGDNSSATIDSPRNQDDVIRPYENCQRWQNEVKDNPHRLNQANAYYETEDFKMVAESLKQRTGISRDLSHANVTALFNLCRFLKSWEPSATSPWCALFTAHDIEILEYIDDLLHFYRNGYGSALNPKLGATALKDLYETMDHVKTLNTSKVVAYFTHDTMMEMVFSAMGLFDDGENLIASDRRHNRKWRTTFISPFAVNLVATMYKCDTNVYRVTFHINEKILKVCPGDWCSWEEFHNKFHHFIDTNLKFCDQ